MATSGYTDVKFTDYNTLRYSWEVTETNAANNTVSVQWKLLLIAGQYGAITSSANKNGYVTSANIPTKNYANLQLAISNNSTKQLATAIMVLNMPTVGDGTFNYSFGVYADITFNGKHVGWVEGTGVGRLDAINKQPYITSATDFTDESNPTIYYDTSTVRNLSKLEACISADGGSIDVPYRTIPITSSANNLYTFPLTEAERESLRALVTKGSTTTVWFYIRSTFNNGKVVYGKPSTKNNFTIVNGTPTLNPAIVDQNAVKTYELTGNTITLIRYYSRVLCSTGAAARKGAAITSQSILNSNYRISRPTGTFNVSDREFVFTATDSRGQTVTESITKPMVDYIKPTIKVEITKPTNTEFTVLTGSISGDWFNSSFGAVANTYKIEYRYKENGGEYGSWSEVAASPLNNTYTASFAISNVDYRNAYTVQARITDKLFTITSSEVNMLIKPIFDWGRDDFNFNVPISIEGQPLADYVIATGSEAMGTNGTWYWRKWKSGRAEAWGSRNFGAMAVTTAWGGLYRSGTQEQMLPMGLFLHTPDTININLIDSDFGGWICKHELMNATSESSGGFIVVRPASATLARSQITFYVAGRWK